MAVLTLELSEPLFAELQEAATLHQVSTESLLVEIVRHGLRELQAEQHFRERAAHGSPENGLAILGQLSLPVYHGRGGLNAAVTDNLTNRALLDSDDGCGQAMTTERGTL